MTDKCKHIPKIYETIICEFCDLCLKEATLAENKRVLDEVEILRIRHITGECNDDMDECWFTFVKEIASLRLPKTSADLSD